jgi:hypothetical protein
VHNISSSGRTPDEGLAGVIPREHEENARFSARKLVKSLRIAPSPVCHYLRNVLGIRPYNAPRVPHILTPSKDPNVRNSPRQCCRPWKCTATLRSNTDGEERRLESSMSTIPPQNGLRPGNKSNKRVNPRSISQSGCPLCSLVGSGHSS